MAIAPPPPP
ncbi:hypothetical protein CP09DC80_0717A, partial [Chlamydia psittaci 09DC80]